MEIIQEFADLRRKDWVVYFNSLRENNSFSDAARQVWTEFNVVGNPYLRLFKSPEALLFSILTYIPNRADEGGERIAAPGNSISWNSQPIYDTFANYWNNIDGWNCRDWENWHRALEVYYGDTYLANAVWESAWWHADNQCYLASVLLCPQTDDCRYDCTFVEYIASKDMPIGNIFSNTYCSVTNIALNIVRVVENISDAAVIATDTAKYIFPVVAVGLIGVGLYKISEA